MSEPAAPANDLSAVLRPRSVAFLGASNRPGTIVSQLLRNLLRAEFRGPIFPVNPREPEVLGEQSYPSLLEVPEPIDVVDVFRAPDALPGIAADAVAIGAKALWTQYGVINPEGSAIAKAGGLLVVTDRCMKVEHARYLGRMHVLGFNTGQISAKRANGGS